MLSFLKIWHKTGVHDFTHIYIFLNTDWNEAHELTLEKLRTAITNKDETILTKFLLFNKGELHSIKEQDIPISIIDLPIHIDDTINTIKRKIIEGTKLKLAFPEIYLFAVQKIKLIPDVIFTQ